MSMHETSRGELVWFNEAEDHGVLETDDGRRIEFAGEAFANGARPAGRVGGIVVEFELGEAGAREITVVATDAVKRARRRGRS